MLRVCREEITEQSEDFNCPNGLRRCPSVANLFELNRVERTRLENETKIIIDDGIID